MVYFHCELWLVGLEMDLSPSYSKGQYRCGRQDSSMVAKLPTPAVRGPNHTLFLSVGRIFEYYGIALIRLSYAFWQKGFCTCS